MQSGIMRQTGVGGEVWASGRERRDGEREGGISEDEMHGG